MDDFAILASALEDSRHLVAADPKNPMLIRAHRLLCLACRDARHQRWERCWRHVDQAIPGFPLNDCVAISPRLIRVCNHLHTQPPVLS